MSVSSADKTVHSPLRGIVGAAAILAILSFISIAPPEKVAGGNAVPGQGQGGSRTGDELAAGEASDSEQVAIDPATGQPVTSAGGRTTSKKKKDSTAASGSLECAVGKNGGSTDKGVSKNRIRLASTNVRSGPGSSFLGSSWVGMQAAVNRVNGQGGICGRLLELRIVDDGWSDTRGRDFIEQFISEDYFALPVVPSSEGLTAAIKVDIIKNAKIPVVGTDGMLKEQYDAKDKAAYVWPVAAATVTQMRVMAKHAYDSKGARTFGIVWDNRYRFGREGASTFECYVTGRVAGSDETCPVNLGATLKANVPIDPGRASYSGEAQQFNDQCGAARCEMVAMLLDPSTANTWISSNGGFGSQLTGGAQPLFNDKFARECKTPCDGMLLWTGYNPPIGPIANRPGVADYINDVRSVDPGVDITNQFLEGAYLGMRVFVEALKKIGPGLTRERAVEEMNQMSYTSDLSASLKWSAGNHFANNAAQAFRVAAPGGSFGGFADAGTGFVADPTPGVVPRDRP